ncbi:beta-endoglucanase [Nannochloropsis oceanica]
MPSVHNGIATTLATLLLLLASPHATTAREHGAPIPKDATPLMDPNRTSTPPMRMEEPHAFPPKVYHVPAPSKPKGAEKYSYGHVMKLSLLFYEAQRSGKLPKNNRIDWRDDSALEDGKDVGVDLTGGWYDAGDHVKFNFPMAWSATTLAWGVHEFYSAWQDAGELENVLDSLKWVTDYLIKCHPDKDTYYVQVGNGNGDHNYWGSAETMSMDRPSYAVGRGRQAGSDAAAEAAAALAATSLVFAQHGDTVYANKLKATAMSLYALADATRGGFSISEPFYKSSDWRDEMAWAAAFLYEATQDEDYLKAAESWYEQGGLHQAWAFSWDSKGPGVQLLLLKLTKDEGKRAVYKRDAENFVGGAMSKEQTPKGLAYWDQWGSNRYASNGAFIAVVGSMYDVQTERARAWSTKQINYILGDAHGGVNKQTGLPHYSFVCGYGDDFPRAPHHRGSSCRSGTDCTCNDSPQPHILYGALVGGPGRYDDYSDSCTDYTKNEVTTDYNAGFTSALAGLRHLALIGKLPTEY